jgi:hypothetical protein
MSGRLPEEEEYERAQAEAPRALSPSSAGWTAGEGAAQGKALWLLGLAFGIALVFGLLLAVTTAVALLVGPRRLVLLNLVWIACMVAVLVYLNYLRSRMMLRP